MVLQLQKSSWLLTAVTIGGTERKFTGQPPLTLDAGGFTVFDTCNWYEGGTLLEGQSLTFEPAMWTARGCSVSTGTRAAELDPLIQNLFQGKYTAHVQAGSLVLIRGGIEMTLQKRS